MNSGKPVMYKDRHCAFSSTFLSGMDFDFLMMDALTITFIYRVSDGAGLASRVIFGILIAYILNTIFTWIRSYYGKRNLCKHTLVDEGFLI